MKLWRKQPQDPLDALRGFSKGLESALFLIERSGKIVFSNERAKTLFGFGDMEGRTILAVTLSHNIESLVSRTFSSQSALSAEFDLRTQGDLVVIARTWPNPAKSNQVYLSLRDVTEVRRLETVRQDFVANVSHEIKTPLTTIRAMAEILADVEKDDSELREKYLKQIVGEVDRLSALVDDLLTLSKAERESVEKVPSNISELVEGVVVQLMPKVAPLGLQLDFSATSVAAPVHPAQIKQIALNLIDNAINYSTEGSIMVSVTAEGGSVVITVSDSGIGIPSEDLPRIFERFYRVDKGRSRSSGGTGLGLSIVKHIAEAHGGSVEVESALHQGSTFRVRLPQ